MTSLSLRLTLSASVAIAGIFALQSCCGECGDVAKVMGGTVQLIQEMSSAPGTDELKAAGCDTAMVISPEMMAKFAKTLNDLDSSKNKQQNIPELPYTVVTCQVQRKKAGVDCEAVAKIYGKAATPAPDKFGVTVNVSGQNEPMCAGEFSPEGEKLGEMDKNTTSSVGGVGK